MRKLSSFGLIAAALIGAVVQPSYARAQQLSGLESVARAVPDSRLAEMRGKFLTPSGIGYFGVQLGTVWQRQDGVATRAQLLFSVNFADGAGNLRTATPVLMVSWARDGDSSLDVAGFAGAAAGDYMVLSPQIAGLASAQGVVQSQQIAGSDNRVLNGMQIAIVPVSAVQQGAASGMTSLTGSQTQRFADGSTVQFILDGNQVGLALTGAGTTDAIRQSFNGALGQAAQNVIINSSGNTIHNSMGLTIGYDQLQQSARPDVQNALAALKGIGF